MATGDDGEPLRWCLVSAATREELEGWRRRRISLHAAKGTYVRGSRGGQALGWWQALQPPLATTQHAGQPALVQGAARLPGCCRASTSGSSRSCPTREPRGRAGPRFPGAGFSAPMPAWCPAEGSSLSQAAMPHRPSPSPRRIDYNNVRNGLPTVTWALQARRPRGAWVAARPRCVCTLILCVLLPPQPVTTGSLQLSVFANTSRTSKRWC